MSIGNPFKAGSLEQSEKMLDAYLVLGIMVANEFDNIYQIVDFTGWELNRVAGILRTLHREGIIGFEEREPIVFN